MNFFFTLTPAESKRLIAKGVAQLAEVKRALNKGRVIIATGTTNAFVAEEILGVTIEKQRFTAGVITHGVACQTPPAERLKHLSIIDGKLVDRVYTEVLPEFTAGDVFIKGANAVDPEGNVGILMTGLTGGTIGGAIGILLARGSTLVVPVGLEKLVPSVPAAARALGIGRIDRALGDAPGMMPISTALVVTEIKALEVLTGVCTLHVASGGTGGSEGAVTLLAEGTEEQVRATIALIRSIKGEKPVPAFRRKCTDCEKPCDLIKKEEV